MARTPDGFVALKSLKRKAPAEDALAVIRRIYFKTTRLTIENDLAHAIELLKGLATEEEREKATAYMHGLAELRKEWTAARKKTKAKRPRST